MLLAGCATSGRDAPRSEAPRFRCTTEEGYWQGRAGFSYLGSCTPETESAFLGGHQRGRELYELYRRRAMLEQEISRAGEADSERLQLARRQSEQVSELIRRLEARFR